MQKKSALSEFEADLVLIGTRRLVLLHYRKDQWAEVKSKKCFNQQISVHVKYKS